jgi:hypothetical protein
LCDSTITDQFAALRVKKIVLPSGENVLYPSFAGPETTPGAKTCGVGADEVNLSASWVGIAIQLVVQSDETTRVRIWRCRNDTSTPETLISLLREPADSAFIPFLSDCWLEY